MNWRLILDGTGTGAWNMARDEALLLGATENSSPILRFYDWNPACVSLGRLQKNFDWERHAATPFDVVRRPTGGRAVLHQHEITYCAVIHENRLPRESRSVIGAYEWLSAGFLEGLKDLGVQAELAAGHRAVGAGANCFHAAAQCDFVVDGKKLIGAAQVRRQGVILQHGAILLDLDPAAWEAAVGGGMEGAVSLRSLGITASREEIVEALCQGMRRTWNISFAENSLTVEEWKVASGLHEGKYLSVEWNRHGRLPVHPSALHNPE